MTQINIQISDELHTQLKALSMRKNKPMKELIVFALEQRVLKEEKFRI